MTTTPPEPPGLPVVGNSVAYMRDPFAFLDRAVDDHGDIFMADVLGTERLCVFAHPDYVERALVTDRDAFPKSEGFDVAFGQGLASVEGEQWERQRDALEEFFYPQRIRAYADEMTAITERRVEAWETGGTISLLDQMKALTLENLMATLFDRPLDPEGDADLRQAVADLNLWFKPTSWALPDWVPTPARRRFSRALDTVKREARALLDERAGEDNLDPENDLLSTLVALRRTGDADLSDEEILDQVGSLLFAGHDTTALALSYALHSLGTHPDVRRRFHEEIDDVLDGASPTLADVSELSVTRSIIDESVRLYPPVHTIPRRTAHEVEVAGYHVPADTEIHLSVYRLHRDGRFWDDPREFRPSRWEQTDPQSKGFAYVPFGAGPRVCIGRRFALLEATIALAVIGQRYRLEPESPLELAPRMTNQPADHLPARVEPR